MKATEKIVTGYYRHTETGRIIENKKCIWTVWNEVTGEVYGEHKTKAEAVEDCNQVAEIERWDY